MRRRPPGSTRTDTLFPYTTLFRSLHLEDCGLAVPVIDHARVLARTLDHPGRLGRQLAQVPARGFVGAMLRPHHRKYAEFGNVGRSAQAVEDDLILIRGEAVLGDDRSEEHTSELQSIMRIS